MNFKRRTKHRNFTQIDNGALRNKSLSLKAKGMLGLMMSCPEDWRFNLEWLVDQSKDGRDGTRAAVQELMSERYVVRITSRGKAGRYAGYDYLVDDVPMVEGDDPEGQDEKTTGDGFSGSREAETGDGFSDFGAAENRKSNTTNTDFKNTDLTKTVVVEGQPPENDFLPQNEPTQKNPYAIARSLKGSDFYAWRDLANSSQPADLTTAIALAGEHYPVFHLLAELRADEKASGATFRLWAGDVLAHVNASGASAVEAALKTTLQTPAARIRKDRWSFYRGVLESPPKPRTTTAKRAASSKRSSGDVKPGTSEMDWDNISEAELMRGVPSDGTWGRR